MWTWSGPDRAFVYFDLILVAYLSDDFSKPQANIATEHFLAIFGNPNNVIQTAIGGMGCVAILACHVHILALNRVQAESIGLKSGVFLSKMNEQNRPCRQF